MQSRTQAYGIVPYAFKVDLSTLIHLMKIIPQSHAQRFVSWVILDTVKLGININHYILG